MESSAKSVIREYIEAVYDDIAARLTQQMGQIQQSRQAVHREVISAVERMTKFLDDNKIDAQFVR